MNKFTALLIAFFAGLSAPAHAQQAMPAPAPAEAPAEPDAIPLYGESNPGTSASETWMGMGGMLAARNITYPTLTPVLPEPGTETGAAAVVAPGGAFMILAMDHEGWQVARALADRGITAFVLKYRLIETPADDAAALAYIGQRMMSEIGDPTNGSLLAESPAPADALAALAMVRGNAAAWNIDPERVGMIGFSAGAMTSLQAALAEDAAARPDFFGYIYGPQDAVEVPEDAPPMFNAIAWDDSLFPTRGFPIAEAWHAAGIPVELHAYQTGNHGFGLGAPGSTNALLADQFAAWLRANGWLGESE